MDTLIIFTAKYLYLLVILGSLFVLYKEGKLAWSRIILILIIALPLVLILTLTSSHFINDPRPFVIEHVQPLITHNADNGFPSDHTLVSMFAAMLVFVFNKKCGAVLIMLAAFVGISRVLAKVHHPLDIAGSIIIAFISLTTSWLILRKFKQI